MSEIVVYGVPGSPYVRSALLGLEEKHLPYRLRILEPRETKSAEHLRRQPFGRMPTLEHDGFQLYETQAILRYLDTLGSGPSLQPADARASARMNQIMGIIDWYAFPALTVGVCVERLFAQLIFGRPTDENKVAQSLPTARICFEELARLKGSAPFMAGDALSLADLMVAPPLEYFKATPEGASLFKGSSLDTWLTRMQARASMQATQPERLRQTA